MKKQLALLIAAGVMVLGSSFTALAGEWKQDNAGWWWQRDDGSYPRNQWEWLDGNRDGISECYYFDSNGYMLTNTTTPDNFTVNESGAWVENGYAKMMKAGRPAAKISGLTVVAPEGYVLQQTEEGYIAAASSDGQIVLTANAGAVHNNALTYLNEEGKEKTMDTSVQMILGTDYQKEKVSLISGEWYRYNQPDAANDMMLSLYMRYTDTEIHAVTVIASPLNTDTNAVMNAAVQ